MTTDTLFPDYCYVAFHDCGGWIAVTVDCPDMRKHNARHLSSWIKANYKIERMTVDAFKNATFVMCNCQKPKKTKIKDLFEVTP